MQHQDFATHKPDHELNIMQNENNRMIENLTMASTATELVIV